MIYDQEIYGNDILLRILTIQDCNEKYVKWMNDYETNKFMETKWSVQNRDTITEFVMNNRSSSDSYLFAIVEAKTNNHVGNIKIGPINKRYKYADISYFIGEKDCRGKGYAQEAISLICTFGFDTLMLHRVQASVIEENKISSHVLTKCGFKLEGRLKDRFIRDDVYLDCLIYGKTEN